MAFGERIVPHRVLFFLFEIGPVDAVLFIGMFQGACVSPCPVILHSQIAFQCPVPLNNAPGKEGSKS